MKRIILRTCLASSLLFLLMLPASGQKASAKQDIAEALKGYFKPAGEAPVAPDDEGFIRRWLMLDPISKPDISVNSFTERFVRHTLSEEFLPGDKGYLPKKGEKVKLKMAYQPPVDVTARRRVIETAAPDTVKATLVWHPLDSDHFFIKLIRFAAGLNKDRFCVVYNQVTVLNCEEDIENVRLSVGSNKSSMWWLNGEEVLVMPGDRYMVADNNVSKRITLKKGKNILRGAVLTGTGMSECCVRILDENGKPFKNYTISCE